MRLWFSRDDLASMAHMRADHHDHGELPNADSLEFSRAVTAALGDDERASLALEWSVLSAAHRASCLSRQAIRDALPSVPFDLDGEDSGFNDAADYLKRFSALDASLAACPYVEGQELRAWAEALKRSISVSLEEKERIAQNGLFR